MERESGTAISGRCSESPRWSSEQVEDEERQDREAVVPCNQTLIEPALNIVVVFPCVNLPYSALTCGLVDTRYLQGT